MDIFVVGGVLWAIGIVSYIKLDRMNKFNNVNFIDVTNHIKKYKKSDEKTSIKKK